MQNLFNQIKYYENVFIASKFIDKDDKDYLAG
jgi:hypothetical protein